MPLELRRKYPLGRIFDHHSAIYKPVPKLFKDKPSKDRKTVFRCRDFHFGVNLRRRTFRNLLLASKEARTFGPRRNQMRPVTYLGNLSNWLSFSSAGCRPVSPIISQVSPKAIHYHPHRNLPQLHSIACNLDNPCMFSTININSWTGAENRAMNVSTSLDVAVDWYRKAGEISWDSL